RDELDAGTLERRRHARVIRAQVVIAENAQLAKARRNALEQRSQSFDVVGAHRDEVAAKKQEIRLELGERLRGTFERTGARRRTGVEVGREGDAKGWTRRRICRSRHAQGGGLDAQPALKPRVVREGRRPVMRPKYAVEGELERAPRAGEASVANDRPPVDAGGHSLSDPSASSSKSSGASRVAAACFFFGRPPRPLAAAASSCARYSRRAAAIAWLSRWTRCALAAFSRR